MDRDDVKENMKQDDIWKRALQMFILLIAMSVVEFVIFAIIILQFCWKLFTKELLENLDKLSRDLCYYAKNTCLFLVFVRDEPTFPFADWEESVK